MRLRPGTLVDLFDRTAVPSEASLGEICAIIGECGFNVTAVEDTWSDTIIRFTCPSPIVNGSIRVDRSRSSFDVLIADDKGEIHRLQTRSDSKAFEYVSSYLSPRMVNEEVDIRDKYKNLSDSARDLLSWLLRQYSSGGIYAFSPNDIGSDMSQSARTEGIDLLIQQGFLRMTRKDTLVLDRTLADDMRSMDLDGTSDDGGLEIV
jgi:hypothetical protein